MIFTPPSISFYLYAATNRWVGQPATADGKPRAGTVVASPQKRWRSPSLARHPPPPVGRERSPASLSSLPVTATAASAWEANNRAAQPASPTRGFFAASPVSSPVAAERDGTASSSPPWATSRTSVGSAGSGARASLPRDEVGKGVSVTIKKTSETGQSGLAVGLPQPSGWARKNL